MRRARRARLRGGRAFRGVALLALALALGLPGAAVRAQGGVRPPVIAEADVLAHPIARGAILRAADFERRPVAPAQARFALTAHQAEGMEARRGLAAGATLRAGDLGPPTLVHRGDALTVHWRQGALDVAAPGRAMADAAADEPVRVLNLATGKVLDARVRASGEVEILAP